MTHYKITSHPLNHFTSTKPLLKFKFATITPIKIWQPTILFFFFFFFSKNIYIYIFFFLQDLLFFSPLLHVKLVFQKNPYFFFFNNGENPFSYHFSILLFKGLPYLDRIFFYSKIPPLLEKIGGQSIKITFLTFKQPTTK